MSSFFSRDELEAVGFESLGIDVKVSRRTGIYHPERISLGNHVRIDDFCVLSACSKGYIKIGSHCYIGAMSFIEATAGFVMDDFSTLAARVTVYSGTDDYSGEHLTNPCVPDRLRRVTSGIVTVGRHSIIGTCSTLMPGVTIGEGTAVGANSLVTKDLPPKGIYAGCPVRLIKRRSDSVLHLEQQLSDDE